MSVEKGSAFDLNQMSDNARALVLEQHHALRERLAQVSDLALGLRTGHSSLAALMIAFESLVAAVTMHMAAEEQILTRRSLEQWPQEKREALSVEHTVQRRLLSAYLEELRRDKGGMALPRIALALVEELTEDMKHEEKHFFPA